MMSPVQLAEALKRTIENERSAFYSQFGRNPTYDDPVFFDDGEEDEPSPMKVDELRRYLEELSRRLDFPPAQIYAVHKLARQPKHLQTFDLRKAAVLEYELAVSMLDLV
jgi:hypothetical protein